MLYAGHLFSLQIRNTLSSARVIRHMKKYSSVQKNGPSINLRSLNEFGLGTNTLTKYLLRDEVELQDGSEIFPKQLRKKHFVHVLPEKVPTPSFIAASTSCARMLQLDPIEFQKKQFADAFSGNELLPGLDVPYATVYGCHSFGQWFGQLGDGRALSIGDVYTTAPLNEDHYRNQFYQQPPPSKAGTVFGRQDFYGDHLQELQLKGCGRSPFSRGFDGRAVLRSSVREYLVSEAMFHLGVPTTRALSLIGTGMEISRPWYAATSSCNNYTPPVPSPSSISNNTNNTPSNATSITPLRKFAPDYLLREPGAVLCRVSRSFLRFGQLELFAMRREFDELTMLADYVCFREFPELLEIEDTEKDRNTANETVKDSTDSVLLSGNVTKDTIQQDTSRTGTGTVTSSSSDFVHDMLSLPESLVSGPPERYVEMFRIIAQRNAALVADWLRVGYVQGNMNSDNTMLAGRTIDYGPYGWMERYDPLYQPFTTDRVGNFVFSRQPAAMGLNVGVLGETTIAPLVQHVYMKNVEAGCTPMHSLEHYLQQVTHIFEVEYAEYFAKAYDEVKRRKLGLFAFDSCITTTAASSDFTTNRAEQGASAAVSISADQQLWLELELLMAASDVDFTILFRELGKVAELLVETEATTRSAQAAAASTTSSSTTAAATAFVPSAVELGLFPNIPFATEQSQIEHELHEHEQELKQQHKQQVAQAVQVKHDNAQDTSAAGTTVTGSATDTSSSGELEDLLLDRALALLSPAFYYPDKLQEARPIICDMNTSSAATSTATATANGTTSTASALLAQQWTAWLQRYQQRLLQDAQADLLSVQDRRALMDATNPKYVIRNWMAAMAYERSAEGDHSIIQELSALLEQPYDEQSAELQQRWYAKTPDWAQNLPGVAFMSCSS